MKNGTIMKNDTTMEALDTARKVWNETGNYHPYITAYKARYGHYPVSLPKRDKGEKRNDND